ncbi:peptidoglycan/LPS O-acetylase OafA/YrhL [Variovorax boronicumulans]|uniref:Peptidoglycan/LPS O-acetylase OafA/YrhL n=1 Tax=Variovorax boronicumulans TaxID=436515 RepID=A0AAW8D5C4_9BURK|nr:acyltransferase [Variovorax boronicumulans]MDP9895197.1 peptidoglycan/LPS O-acetylase OafA/YrhL [Variovorax boronicumulans]MDQ0034234.1 peptidoglycan/LPS O-acetylase OafA/YrhL [Variovorax boronicumulans]MDQ0055015.1 peptidoglycan/LPS O-acetylase OafA/YrhL [Variovorax boronicumulans]
MGERGTAISFEDFQGTRNFGALDGLRAISVFLVFSDHFGGIGWTRFSGWLGVHAFFVLSGFLITTLLLRERDGTGRISLKAFYIRRTTRLLPLYLLVLLAVLALSYVAQDGTWEQMKAATPYYLTLLNEMANVAPLHMTWTLGVEWKYYLVWPTLLVVFGTTLRSGLATVGFCLAALAMIDIGGFRWDLLLPQNYVGMLFGSALALLMNSRRTFALVRGLMNHGTAIALVVALLVVHRRFPVIAGRIGDASAIALYSLLIAMLIPALVASRTWIARALTSKPLVFVGHRSYAMYLVQYVAAHTVIAVLPAPTIVGGTLLFLSFALALVLSDQLYRWFEKPITDWGHRWAKAVKQAALSKTPLPGCDAAAAALGPAGKRSPL